MNKHHPNGSKGGKSAGVTRPGGGSAMGIDAMSPDDATMVLDTRIYSKVFVISGSLTSLTHAEVRRALENRGALFSRRLSKKTDYLIVGRKPGSEAVTARIYGIPIITESALLEILGLKKQLSLNLQWPEVE